MAAEQRDEAVFPRLSGCKLSGSFGLAEQEIFLRGGVRLPDADVNLCCMRLWFHWVSAPDPKHCRCISLTP